MQRFIFLACLMVIFSGCKSIDTLPTKDERGDKMLTGVRVAILLTDGFEQVEMTGPRDALKAQGAKVVLISPKKRVQGYHHDQAADSFEVDMPLNDARAVDFHALLLPGGVKNPDSLRLVPKAIQFIKDMGQAHKPIAAICHGPWTLIDAELVKGKTITSWPSLKVDLKNAGAHWVDREVVVSDNLVTSRNPDDIPAFNQAMIKLFVEAKK